AGRTTIELGRSHAAGITRTIEIVARRSSHHYAPRHSRSGRGLGNRKPCRGPPSRETATDRHTHRNHESTHQRFRGPVLPAFESVSIGCLSRRGQINSMKL